MVSLRNVFHPIDPWRLFDRVVGLELGSTAGIREKWFVPPSRLADAKCHQNVVRSLAVQSINPATRGVSLQNLFLQPESSAVLSRGHAERSFVGLV